jgi:peptidoglycan/xylan/chitin deacetylase (PgdA/CDA1 family)
MWNNMAYDWLMPAPGIISLRVTNVARNGMIILLHDGGGDRANTVAALPTIIQNLRTRGFRFVTLSQLVEHARI